MKFIALVSGGKDSCFNIMHCLNAGHELVAMANLHPRAGRPDEIDSWMFQTVGYQAVEYIAECAEVPLFRAEISEDEDAVVNELAALFTVIKQSIDFEGVSVGAIGSTYQQVRVDQACSKVGIISLAYLWQRDQRELLHEIVKSGLDARIIKVAGMGLSERHLGQSLAEAEPELLIMHKNFGLHPCGEGGEYETMVFDAPFFKSKKLAFSKDSVNTVKHSNDDVYYLQFGVTIEAKTETSVASIDTPPLISPEFQDLLDQPVYATLARKGENSVVPFPKDSPKVELLVATGTFDEAFTSLTDYFETHPEPGILPCFHVMVALKDMSRFAEMNAKYIDVFKKSIRRVGDAPPSRACIQAHIPWDIEITVCQGKQLDPSGKGVHVQGLSYWAPASIGPYSQCRLVFGVSYIAGQIALIPPSLALEDGQKNQALLALQNATRILDVVHEDRKNWRPRLCVAYATPQMDRNVLWRVWERFSSIPLVIAVVDQLPRGALVEWSIQACDMRYFAWFTPDDDEAEERYSATPEFIQVLKRGYTHRCGFQILKVSVDPVPDASMVFSVSSRRAPENLIKGHWVPARSIFYNETEVDTLYIQS